MAAAEYYPLVEAAAASTGLDWWLIYGVIEQESNFDPAAESDCGALGLMQLMPATFPAWSRTSLLDPANNVKLGAQHLRECIAIWKLEPADEKIKFGLASYNGGPGYVLAAQYAAQMASEDTTRWATVEPFLESVRVAGKHCDAQQISGYVSAVWRRYAARRGAPIPRPGTGAAA
jgi:soluble lytic murein transglycosylase-like protein